MSVFAAVLCEEEGGDCLDQNWGAWVLPHWLSVLFSAVTPESLTHLGLSAVIWSS